MHHAPDEMPVPPHGPIQAYPKALYPETKAFFQIGAWYERNAGFDWHADLGGNE
jgi:hypothetical protein